MAIDFVLLADRTDAIPIVSRWYHEEWGPLFQKGPTDSAHEQLLQYLNRNTVPLMLLAAKGDEIVGAAQLKLHEMADLFPDRKFWLGGLYVAPDYRGSGLGSRIVGQIKGLALSHGVRKLHLQTQALDGGLYARLGWRPFACAKNHGLNVLVMECDLCNASGGAVEFL